MHYEQYALRGLSHLCDMRDKFNILAVFKQGLHELI
jgi:hypothetical protein